MRTEMRGRWLVPALTLAVFVNFLGSLALSPFLPTLSNELGVSVALLGQVPALMMLVAAALGLGMGPLVELVGHRWTLLLGLWSVAISSLGTGLASTYTVLLLAVLISGFGRAAVLPVAQSVIGAYIGDYDARRRAIGRTMAGQSGAAILGVPLLTTIASLVHWRAAFFVLAALALVGVATLWGVLVADPPRIGEHRFRSRQLLDAYAPLLRHRPSLGLLAGIILGNASIWVVATYTAAFYVQQYRFTTEEVGWVYLAIGVAILLGNLAAGDRLGGSPRSVTLVSRASSAVLVAAGLALPLSAVVATTLVSSGALMHGINLVASVTLLTDESPAGRPTTLTLNGAALSCGVALGGALGGVALGTGGYVWVGVCALALGLVSTGVMWSSTRAARGFESRAAF